MLPWGSQPTTNRFHVVLDIGSGTVGAAIIDTEAQHSGGEMYVWSKRVHLVFNEKNGADRLVHALKTGVMNALLMTNSEGRKALEQRDEKANLTTVHCFIAAPWVHTAPRRVHYNREHPFMITEALVNDLTDEADQSILEQLAHDPLFTTGAIEVLSTHTTHLEINGYLVDELRETEAKTLSFSHYTSFIAHTVQSAVRNLVHETFGNVPVRMYAFMPHFTEALIALQPSTSFCVCDITHEATEIAIVRDNVLSTMKQSPIGISTLAREIAAIKKAPIETGYQVLRTEHLADVKMTTKQRERITELLSDYEQSLSKLLGELEDDLLPPPHLFIHTDHAFEAFFTERMKRSFRHLYTNDVSIETTMATDLMQQAIPAGADAALSFAGFMVQQKLI